MNIRFFIVLIPFVVSSNASPRELNLDSCVGNDQIIQFTQDKIEQLSGVDSLAALEPAYENVISVGVGGVGLAFTIEYQRSIFRNGKHSVLLGLNTGCFPGYYGRFGSTISVGAQYEYLLSQRIYWLTGVYANQQIIFKPFPESKEERDLYVMNKNAAVDFPYTSIPTFETGLGITLKYHLKLEFSYVGMFYLSRMGAGYINWGGISICYAW